MQNTKMYKERGPKPSNYRNNKTTRKENKEQDKNNSQKNRKYRNEPQPNHSGVLVGKTLELNIFYCSNISNGIEHKL